jgi:hypothetical protein
MHTIRKTSWLILMSYLFLVWLARNALAQPGQGEVHGHVKNALTQAGIANARIIVAGLKKEAVTDEAGFFRIILPSGKHRIEVNAARHRRSHKEVLVTADGAVKIDFALQPVLYQIAVIDVIAERLKFPKAGRIDLQARELRSQPALAEPDVFRAIQTLPGVSSVSDWSSELYVRGGHFDQTLILWDGAPIYNPSHLGGIFSSFNPESIERVRLYRGGQPLHFDDRLSGLLEIKPSFGQRDRHRSTGFWGIASSSVAVDGPLAGGSYALSVRRTYFDLLSRLVAKEAFPYSFWDASAAYTMPLSEKDVLSLSAFFSSDRLQEIDDDPVLGENDVARTGWGNRLVCLRWRHLLGTKRVFELSLFRTLALVDGSGQDLQAKNRIDEIGLTSRLFAEFSSHTLLASLELRKPRFSYSWSFHTERLADFNPLQDVFFDYAPPDFNFRKEPKVAALAMEDELALSRKVSLSFGLKGNWNSLARPLRLTPRVVLTYRASERFSFRAVAGRYYQYVYTLKERRTDEVFAPFTIYFPIDDASAIPPSRADHLLVSVEGMNLPLKMELSAEAYVKNYHDLVTSSNDLPRLRLENGIATGFDLHLTKKTGRATAALGYSFGISKKRNAGTEYYTSHDRRHSVKLIGELPLGKKWSISAFWTFATGAPYTPVIGHFLGGADSREETYDDFTIDWPPISRRAIEGEKNSLRFPDYHRLDVAFQGRFQWGKARLFPLLQILNVYNRANVFYHGLDLMGNPEKVSARDIPILPTLGLRVEF